MILETQPYVELPNGHMPYSAEFVGRSTCLEKSAIFL